MKKPATIVDIARALKISVSTVSKALNDHPAIGEFTKERVKAKALEMNYVPNQAARSFQQKKTFQIGVILPSLRDPFYVETVCGMEAAAIKKNYFIFLCQTHEDQEREKTFVEMMRLKRVDAVIITITRLTSDLSHIHKLEEMGIPVMFLVRIPPTGVKLSVKNNVFDAAFQATNFLIARKHRRIAHIKGPDVLVTSQERLAGYKAALEAAGIAFDPEMVVETDLSRGGNESAIQSLINLKKPPTAVLAFKDNIALDAATWLKKEGPAGVKNPEWVGFGNSDTLRYLDNALSASVEEQPYFLGEQAAEKVIEYLEKSENPDAEPESGHWQYSCKLVVFK